MISTYVRMYNDICGANKGLIKALQVALAILIVTLTPGTAQASPVTKPEVREIIERMMDAQANLVGYQGKASVRMKVGKIRIPTVNVFVELRRPADMSVRIAGYTAKPNYPIFPDPMSLMGDDYELKMLGDDTYFKVEAIPQMDAKSPYRIILWVDRVSYLPKKAKLSLPNGDFSLLEANYMKMGDKCWVTRRVTCQGSMLVKDILPIMPVEMALKLVKNPQDVWVEAVFSDVKLL